MCMASLPPEQETKDLISKHTEARLKLESGVNFIDFQKIKQDIYVATNVYLENNPDGDFNKDFNSLLSDYDFASIIWKYKINNSLDFLPKTKERINVDHAYFEFTQGLIGVYPTVFEKTKYDPGYGYFTAEVLVNMFSYIGDKTKTLKQNIINSY